MLTLLARQLFGTKLVFMALAMTHGLLAMTMPLVTLLVMVALSTTLFMQFPLETLPLSPCLVQVSCAQPLTNLERWRELTLLLEFSKSEFGWEQQVIPHLFPHRIQRQLLEPLM